jgi:REP element-mobilizing transposase RayT
LKEKWLNNLKEKYDRYREWKDVEILELTIMKDHIHMVVTIPPRLSISEMMGILKGKTAISIFKENRVENEKILGESFLE